MHCMYAGRKEPATAMKLVKKFLTAFRTLIENCCTQTPVKDIFYHIVNDAKQNTASFFILRNVKSENDLFISHIFRFPIPVFCLTSHVSRFMFDHSPFTPDSYRDHYLPLTTHHTPNSYNTTTFGQ